MLALTVTGSTVTSTNGVSTKKDANLEKGAKNEHDSYEEYLPDLKSILNLIFICFILIF